MSILHNCSTAKFSLPRLPCGHVSYKRARNRTNPSKRYTHHQHTTLHKPQHSIPPTTTAIHHRCGCALPAQPQPPTTSLRTSRRIATTTRLAHRGRNSQWKSRAETEADAGRWMDGWTPPVVYCLDTALDGAVEEWATPDIQVALIHVLLCLTEIGKSLV